MKHLLVSCIALTATAVSAQAVVNPGAVNQIAGPGSASVVAPGQLKKDFGVSPKYTAPGQVKKIYDEPGKGNFEKGNPDKGNQGKGRGK